MIVGMRPGQDRQAMPALDAVFLVQGRDHPTVDSRIVRLALPAPEGAKAQVSRSPTNEWQLEDRDTSAGDRLTIAPQENMTVPALPVAAGKGCDLLAAQIQK